MELSFLIIDDLSDSAELLATLLKRQYPSCRTAIALRGEEGIARARSDDFDLILLDAKMPGLDGFETCRALKADARAGLVPVLMVSGNMLETRDRVAGLQCGADGYVCKPFEIEEFAAQVQALVRLKRDEDALRAQEKKLQDELEARTRALRESEERFRTMFESSPDAVFVENRDGTVLDVNPAAGALHGMSREELIGRNMVDLVPPGHRDVVMREFPKWFTGDLKVYDGYSYHRDGRVIPVEIKASRIEYKDAPAALLIVRDMTDRPHIEDRQSATVRGLRAIVDIADELITCPDADTLYRRAVELARERLALERAAIFLADGPYVRGTFGTDMQGRTTDERSHRIPMDELWRDRFRLRGPNEPRWNLSLEYLQDWEDGEMRPRGQGWVAITPMQTASTAVGVLCNDSALTRAPFDPVRQEIVAVYASLLGNIIERRMAETERTRLALAVEQSAEAVVITDVQGVIQYVNAAFERITGYSRAEALGQYPRILKSGRHHAAFYEDMWKHIVRGDAWTGRITNRRKDGVLYESEQTISPVRNGRGEVTGYLCVGQDVTRSVQMESQLRQAQKLDSIGRLAGGIAHDFNNLLTGILGFGRVVLDELGPGHVSRPDVEEIILAGERAAKLTRQLLAFGHKQVIQVQPMDLNAVVVNMDQILRRTLGEHIELITMPAPDLRSVEADPGLMEQVVMNLAVNARDAMPRGGRLVLRTANVTVDSVMAKRHTDVQPGGYALFSVRDTGVGMTPEVKAQIFEPFFTTKEKGKGSGLGLSTVYGIVRQCGGFIEVDSDVGTGAEFRIYLPSVDVHPPSRAVSEPRETPQGGRETLLVVEDEGMVRRLTIRGLKALGYTVLEARNGEDALRVVEKHSGRLDLVLTDVIMPRMGGPELVEQLRQSKPDLKFIYMTGFTEDVRVEDIRVGNAAPLILKPFTMEALAVELRRMLDGR